MNKSSQHDLVQKGMTARKWPHIFLSRLIVTVFWQGLLPERQRQDRCRTYDMNGITTTGVDSMKHILSVNVGITIALTTHGVVNQSQRSALKRQSVAMSKTLFCP